ncbi:hypothetical protein U9M48_026888 [Paspalum notatum var. saurae]|uniref:Uncharacterized protein n=1 Tax=Paspalum notatum var. saurae TaxID=547442 RepID=A0AAQ3TTI4_PASNO
MPLSQWKPMTGFVLLRASWTLLIVKAMIEFSSLLIGCMGKHMIGGSPTPLLIQSRKKSVGESFANKGLCPCGSIDQVHATVPLCSDDVDEDGKKQDCFREGPNPGLRYALSSNDYRSFQKLVDKAFVIERERKILDDDRKREMSYRGQGSSTRPRYSPPRSSGVDPTTNTSERNFNRVMVSLGRMHRHSSSRSVRVIKLLVFQLLPSNSNSSRQLRSAMFQHLALMAHVISARRRVTWQIAARRNNRIRVSSRTVRLDHRNSLAGVICEDE